LNSNLEKQATAEGETIMNVQVRTQRPPTLFYWISLFVLIAIVFAPFAPAEAAKAGAQATDIESLRMTIAGT
jgi:hypothetical protein